jgi:hypothetical protein
VLLAVFEDELDFAVYFVQLNKNSIEKHIVAKKPNSLNDIV